MRVGDGLKEGWSRKALSLIALTGFVSVGDIPVSQGQSPDVTCWIDEQSNGSVTTFTAYVRGEPPGEATAKLSASKSGLFGHSSMLQRRNIELRANGPVISA